MMASPDDDDLELQAYLDGECDANAAHAFEKRLASDEGLRLRFEQMLALSNALRAIPQEDMPATLRARVGATVAGESPRGKRWSWRALAAAVIVGVLISAASILALDQYRSRQELVQQVIASHVRGLLASQPFDVASSDSHVVRPWFISRIARSPQVLNLAQQGFTLSGGRIDVVGNTPVPTVVYKHDTHVVSLTVLAPGLSLPVVSRSGYQALSWSDGKATYVAVCDLPVKDLANFRRIFTAASS
ncbi:anti-sigma factor [Afipia sp. 1NLS2]|uniref:anti-sigma factor family protein n=1 Tax=Afipia sp. 1NLS2 TaxID=666684 RepID=UPI0001DA04C9|nr:anti-sigma factor [Afipia sp. 1NLS2]EFI50145.1 putative transmembrane anti-sigma factor [Afipia sp. 1NLS2]MBE0702898.1 anti-sigma factor [Afipia sp.]